MKISSKWPKSVLGIKPVLDAVKENIENPGLPLVKSMEGEADDLENWYDPDFLMSYSDYIEVKYSSWIELHLKIPFIPEENQKYVFSGNSLEVDLNEKKCALYWLESIVAEVNSRKRVTEPNTVGRYDPSTDTWTQITTEGVPEAEESEITESTDDDIPF